MQIVDYKVIIVTDFTKRGIKLSSAVQEAMSDGWVPIGGVSVNGGQFAQAVVKYKKESL